MDAELKQFGDWWTATHGREGVSYLDLFLRGYVECALWSSNDESDELGGLPMDRMYGPEDIDAGAMAKMRDDCRAFMAKVWPEGLCDDMHVGHRENDTGRWTVEEQAGHDFWLTRNGHGAGYFDGDWPEFETEIGAAISCFPEVNLYVGGDGKIHAG